MKKLFFCGCRPRQGKAERVGICFAAGGVILLLSLAVFSSRAVDQSSNGAAPSVEVDTNKNRVVSDSEAADLEVAALGRMLTNRVQEVATRTAAVESAFKRHHVVMVTFTALLVLMVLLIRFGRNALARICGFEKGPERRGPNPLTDVVRDLGAEEKAFAEFAASFRIGPKTARAGSIGGTSVVNVVVEKPAAKESRATPTPRTPGEFLKSASANLRHCRVLLQQIGRNKVDAQKSLIGELSAEIRPLKADASHPDLAPFWQLTSALEGLIKHLTDKPENINSSTLRTIAGCVDSLDRLCAAGPNPDLLKSPPVRFLAVDDDPISRHTISFALKRALNAPDVAPNGAAGLSMAEANAYDAIFLDIQMPEMDGLELCRKIRAGGTNQSTPIVFVTCQSDFNSRAQSSIAGGCDLIGKPFLTFEVTAKALLLALGKRLSRLTQAQARAA